MYGDGTFQASVNTFWNSRIIPDLGFQYIIYITLSLSVLWWFISYLLVVFLGFVDKYLSKLLQYGKYIIFLAVFYLVVKILIFDFTYNLQTPYNTLISLGSTGVSGLVMGLAKNKIIKK
jgi:hypothetical protein